MKPALLEHLQQWALNVDGPLVETSTATLLPVIYQHQAAMLKVSTSEEEARGYALLEWWSGRGAAKVLARSGPAILMERATGSRSLATLSRTGKDTQACTLICTVVAKLHEARPGPLPPLISLHEWFQALRASQNELLMPSRKAMLELLDQPHDVVCLHGDIHHQNILDFGERAWLAIDPKGLVGERAFDYANIFCNPDLETACDVNTFLSRLDCVANHAKLERQRLLKWVLAWSGLSAAWHLEDGSSPDTALRIMKMAARALGEVRS